MAINLECPRCKARLRVPNKKAGGYVNCPHCQGRFWADKTLPADGMPAEQVMMALPPVAPPPAPPPCATAAEPTPAAAAGRTTAATVSPCEAIAPAAMPAAPSAPAPSPSLALPPMRTSAQPAVPSAPPAVTPVAPPVVPRPGRKVARFISAEAARSSLQLAADGKLPELHLSDGNKTDAAEKKTSSLSPLALIAIVASSLLTTVMIFLFGGTAPANNAEAQANAWRQIEADYFSDPAGNDLNPYNSMLREARRAHQSHDLKTERELLSNVRDLLRVERDAGAKGLTGSRGRDRKLEEYITVLLNGLKTE